MVTRKQPSMNEGQTKTKIELKSKDHRGANGILANAWTPGCTQVLPCPHLQ